MNHSDLEINEILESIDFIDKFSGKTIFITGATGLIGSAFVEVVRGYNSVAKNPILLLLYVRDIRRALNIFGNDNYIKYVQGEIENINEIKSDIDYIIHAASPTSSKDFVEKPVDVLRAGLLGSINILELARAKQVEKVLFLSSLEVYGTLQTFEANEESFGLIDWMAIRSSYIEAKRASENLFLAYNAQYFVPSTIARLPQILSSSFSVDDKRVYAEFVRAVKNKDDIVLKTTGDSIRNYCYLTDAITGLFTLLAKGAVGQIYNVANEETTCSIREMAELLITMGNKSSRLLFELNENPQCLGYLPTIKIKLLSNKLRKLGWVPKIGLQESMLRMLNKEKKVN